MLHAALQQEEEIRKDHPAMYFVPNIGQERFFNLYKSKRPYISVFGSGNGVGKTTTLAIIAVGLAWGTDELDDYFLDHYIFKWAVDRKEIKKRPGRYRIVCNADSMKEGGAVLQAIEDWFPTGRYELKKNGKTYYSQIVCDNGVTFDVKTFDQDVIAHSGSNLDGILFDEPPPEGIYGECVGRTRDGGFMMYFLTPLEVAAWMINQLIEPADGKDICVVNASIWDNCKDIPGTRGHLSRDDIQKLINEWEKLSPDELDARVNGSFSHLAGAIWKIFKKDIHVIQPFPIPPQWPIYCIIDPHDVRLPALGWFAVGPVAAFGIAEWPHEDYTKIKTSDLTTDQVCEEMRQIEKAYPGQVRYRYMDPNKFNYSQPHGKTKLTVAQEFAKRGFTFMKSDDHLEIGHQRVNALLHYKQDKPLSEYNRPILYFFNTCRNMIDAAGKYAIKKKYNEGSKSLTSKLDQKYKDFADVIRYFAMKMKKYVAVAKIGGFWSQIQEGRKND
jgi:phage terminase large subunit-like protein